MIDALDFKELLSLTPQQALVRIITHSNQVSIAPDHMEFGIPQALVGRETMIKVTGRKPNDSFMGQVYRGSVDFFYKRIDFGELFANTQLSIQMDLPCKTSDVIRVLSHHYGYVFDSSDYVNELITAENAYGYVLKAAPYSLRWWGQVTLTLLKKEALDQVTVVSDFGRLIDPSTVRDFVQHRKHFTDGRFYGDHLKRIPLGDIPADSILHQALGRVYFEVGEANYNWVHSSVPAEANLKGAKVTFNGRAIDLGITPYVFTVSRVLQVELDETLNTKVRGPLTLNYNSQVTELVPEFPEQGYRYPAELWAGLLDGTPELEGFQALYEGTVFTSLPDLTFMDRILGLPEGTTQCSPTPSPVNLFNAEVEYLGRNVGYPTSPDPRLTLIWVVRLDPQYCTYFGGRFLIYYTR